MAYSIADRVEQVKERIEAACRRAGRNPRELSLMAVTKLQMPAAVEEAWDAGMRLFGENRVHDGITKYRNFWNDHPHSDAELHFIGSLQRNKAKAAADFYDCIQSVDRDSLIDELGALTIGREKPLMILLEMHTGEETKAGFPDLESLFRAAERALSFSGLSCRGLMTMAPFTDDTEAIRRSFKTLAAAKGELEKRFPGNWSCLSMGMTNDFEIAIEQGSTLLRIGTAIFGERNA